MKKTVKRTVGMFIAVLFIISLTIVPTAMAERPNPDPDPKPNPTVTAKAKALAIALAGARSEAVIGDIHTEANGYGGDGGAGGAGGHGYGYGGNVENAGNNTGDISIVHRIPMELITPEMIAPITLEDEIFQHLQAVRNLTVDGVRIIFSSKRNFLAINYALSLSAVNVLGTTQNHGKKFLATLHSRAGEYVGPVKQIREMLKDAPESTKCAIVEIRTMTHTRGAAGVAGTGNQSSDWTSMLSANIAGSTALPFAMTTAMFLDQEIEIVNCNDPINFDSPYCCEKDCQEQEEEAAKEDKAAKEETKEEGEVKK